MGRPCGTRGTGDLCGRFSGRYSACDDSHCLEESFISACCCGYCEGARGDRGSRTGCARSQLTGPAVSFSKDAGALIGVGVVETVPSDQGVAPDAGITSSALGRVVGQGSGLILGDVVSEVERGVWPAKVVEYEPGESCGGCADSRVERLAYMRHRYESVWVDLCRVSQTLRRRTN